MAQVFRRAAVQISRLASQQSAQQRLPTEAVLERLRFLHHCTPALQATLTADAQHLADITPQQSQHQHQQQQEAQHTLPQNAALPAAARTFRENLCNAPIRSLACDRDVARPAPGVEESALMRAVLRVSGFYSQESRLIRGAKALYEAVTEQADDDRLYAAVGLEKRFATQYAVLSLHVWLLLVRLRGEGGPGRDLAQLLYENFTEDVERRVRAEGVKVRVSHWLKELEKMFYGSSTAYDQALKGEEDLEQALIRNVYGIESDSRAQASLLARYVKRELACLKVTDSNAVITGKLCFTQSE